MFLADRTSGCITGQSIHIDGGFSVHQPPHLLQSTYLLAAGPHGLKRRAPV